MKNYMFASKNSLLSSFFAVCIVHPGKRTDREERVAASTNNDNCHKGAECHCSWFVLPYEHDYVSDTNYIQTFVEEVTIL